MLQRRKQMKRRLMQVAAKFNKAEDGAAKKWIPYAIELELLTIDIVIAHRDSGAAAAGGM